MKKIILISVILLSGAAGLSARDAAHLESLWDGANTAYINGDYGKAITLYDSIAAEGYASGKLYYNLGNAYFKNNSIGKAIVNYNRALHLSPTDKDAAHNLAVANTYIKDKIEPVPDFFISNWARSLRMKLHANTWAVMSLLFFAAALALALVYFLARKRSVRKTGFFASIVCMLLFVTTMVFAAQEKNKMKISPEAVVITSAISIKSSPETSGKDLFILHEGTKVEVLNAYSSWTEIMIANGNKGWITSDAIELID